MIPYAFEIVQQVLCSVLEENETDNPLTFELSTLIRNQKVDNSDKT